MRTPGRDGHHYIDVADVRRERLRRIAHLLRLHGDDDELGAVDRAGRRLREDADAREPGRELVLLRARRLHHAEVARMRAFRNEATDERRRHVPAAYECHVHALLLSRARTEDRRPDPHLRRPFGDRELEVADIPWTACRRQAPRRGTPRNIAPARGTARGRSPHRPPAPGCP
jgi:hypothetical protein